MPRNPDSSRFGKLYSIYFDNCDILDSHDTYFGIVGLGFRV